MDTEPDEGVPPPPDPGLPEDSDAGAGSTACLAIGSALFVLSFILPAVRTGGIGIPGWLCAAVTLSSISEPEKFNFLAFCSGYLNIVAVFYLGARLTGSLRGSRGFLLYPVILCLIFTWIFFVREKIEPAIGHFLWAAGTLLMTAWEGAEATIAALRSR